MNYLSMLLPSFFFPPSPTRVDRHQSFPGKAIRVQAPVWNFYPAKCSKIAINAIRAANDKLQNNAFEKNNIPDEDCSAEAMEAKLIMEEFSELFHNDRHECGRQKNSTSPPSFMQRVAKWIVTNDIETIEVEFEQLNFADFL
ncbi:hypothetical protein PRIPAC_73463 [Pristionchus pacificus]|uniref:Uncharacterized protein n=1 Tax=Pristionchus pacificus TaxID=54126 RepID=A0A2A6C8Y4_PRIPA|nr:hypothetical protein PRIPAC_73463 [Pristionchus pacificus]|eukprot:PDM74644.1 hypothetical protein PRIPAC_42000 [Pristionchus pacificus]